MTESEKLRVFVSYARKDGSIFAEELVAGLDVAGFDAFLDRHDIAAAEDWENRLQSLIEAADTVVFVLTPGSVVSERCLWEVERALELSKRLVPVSALPVSESLVPDPLRRLNFVQFHGSSFAKSLGLLAFALRTDLPWIREHTRLGELAAHWRRKDCSDGVLLRGAELSAAKKWLSDWKIGAPQPTALHHTFIRASDDAEASRANIEARRFAEIASSQAARELALKQLSRRTTVGLLAAGGLTVAAGGLAWWGNDAERRFRAERARKLAAEVQEAERLAAARVQAIEEAISADAARLDIEGQITGYATSPGTAASDGTGELSPYSTAVLQELQDANRSLVDGLSLASTSVLSETGGKQRPYLSTSLNGPIYLRRQQPARRRHAFCIYVDDAMGGRLRFRNPSRDVSAWSRYLSECGFTVDVLENPRRREVLSKIIDFRFPKNIHGNLFQQGLQPAVQYAGFDGELDWGKSQQREDGYVFVFYSGAGCSQNGVEYIITQDTETIDADSIASTCVSVAEMQRYLREAFQMSTLLLDSAFPDITINSGR